MEQELSPTSLKQLGAKTLGIVWSDGHNSFHRVRNVRLNCPCAHCVDEWTREKILDDAKVPEDVKPKRIEPIGRYALRIVWSDGHDTGFYTFDSLRKLCECPACRKSA